MTQIKSFNHQNLNELRLAYQKAIDDVSKQFGIKSSLGNISFGANNFTVKMTVAIPAVNQAPIVVGHEHTLIGKVFKSGNSEYTIFEAQTGQVRAKNQKGKVYRIKTNVLQGMIQVG